MNYTEKFKSFVKEFSEDFLMGSAEHMYFIAKHYQLPAEEVNQICYLCDELDIDVWDANRVHQFMFFKDSKINRITLPDGVHSIDDRAFAQSSLARIVIPESVKRIHPKAFQGCFLQFIEYKGTRDELLKIPEIRKTFRGCTIKCADQVFTIADSAFTF